MNNDFISDDSTHRQVLLSEHTIRSRISPLSSFPNISSNTEVVNNDFTQTRSILQELYNKGINYSSY